MIYMWFTGINCYKLAVEKNRDSIFTTITTIWKSGLRKLRIDRNTTTWKIQALNFDIEILLVFFR